MTLLHKIAILLSCMFIVTLMTVMWFSNHMMHSRSQLKEKAAQYETQIEKNTVLRSDILF